MGEITIVPDMRRIGKWIAVTLAVALVAAGGAAVWLRLALGASLPRLTGQVRIEDLAAPVRIERDALGVPTITATNRVDVVRATGFLHAQDRFFQMDLQRRWPPASSPRSSAGGGRGDAGSACTAFARLRGACSPRREPAERAVVEVRAG
jgi:penicillin amidase